MILKFVVLSVALSLKVYYFTCCKGNNSYNKHINMFIGNVPML